MIYRIVGYNFIHEKKNIYIYINSDIFPFIRVEKFKIFRYPISLTSYNTTPHDTLPISSHRNPAQFQKKKERKKVHKQIQQF